MKNPINKSGIVIAIEHPMKCFRCGNAMNRKRFFDQKGNFWGWKCLCCGEIVDEVVLKNGNHFGGWRHDLSHSLRKLKKGMKRSDILWQLIMAIKEGDRIRVSLIEGNYRVKWVGDRMVVGNRGQIGRVAKHGG